MTYNIIIELSKGKFCGGCRFGITISGSNSRCVLWNRRLIDEATEDGRYDVKCLECYELELKEGIKGI